MDDKNRPVVLLVGSELDQRKILETILTKKRFDVKLAQTGEEAVQLVKIFDVLDVVLIDSSLIDMSGLKLLELLQPIKKENNFSIITFSSEYQEDEVVQATVLGADSLLVKPFKQDILLSIIGLLLGIKDLVPPLSQIRCSIRTNLHNSLILPAIVIREVNESFFVFTSSAAIMEKEAISIYASLLVNSLDLPEIIHLKILSCERIARGKYVVKSLMFGMGDKFSKKIKAFQPE